MSRLMTKKEIADCLGVSTKTVSRHIQDLNLRGTKVGRALAYTEAQVKKIAESSGKSIERKNLIQLAKSEAKASKLADEGHAKDYDEILRKLDALAASSDNFVTNSYLVAALKPITEGMNDSTATLKELAGVADAVGLLSQKLDAVDKKLDEVLDFTKNVKSVNYEKLAKKIADILAERYLSSDKVVRFPNRKLS